MSRYSGDERRWWLSAPNSLPTIAVIEPVASDAPKREPGARVAPFGFSRALPSPPDREPLLWEGAD